MCHCLAETRDDTIQDDVDDMMVYYLDIDIKSIYIVLVFLNSICLSEITNLVKSPVQFVEVAIVLPNSILDLFLGTIPVPVSFLPCQ